MYTVHLSGCKTSDRWDIYEQSWEMKEMKYLSKYNYLNSVCANVKASAGGETVWLFVCKACALFKHVCLPMSVEGTVCMSRWLLVQTTTGKQVVTTISRNLDSTNYNHP